MKIIIILIAILLGAFNIADAQREYVASKNLEPFVGRWEYKTATETFIIEFKRANYKTPNLGVVIK